MRIRTNFFVTLDGRVSDPDGRPGPAPDAQLLRCHVVRAPGVPGELRAVVMGPDDVVLTSGPLPEGTPPEVRTTPTVAELVGLMESSSGVHGDVHLVGGPSTMQAFREAGALEEVWLHIVPIVVGGGQRLQRTASSRSGSRSWHREPLRMGLSRSDM